MSRTTVAIMAVIEAGKLHHDHQGKTSCCLAWCCWHFHRNRVVPVLACGRFTSGILAEYRRLGLSMTTIIMPLAPEAQTQRRRACYSNTFKMEVVRVALQLPENARIKPTCRAFPGIEPVQIRKWIRRLAPLVELEVGTTRTFQQPPPPPPKGVKVTPAINYRALALQNPKAFSTPDGLAMAAREAAGAQQLTTSVAMAVPSHLALPSASAPGVAPQEPSCPRAREA